MDEVEAEEKGGKRATNRIKERKSKNDMHKRTSTWKIKMELGKQKKYQRKKGEGRREKVE